MRRGSSRHRTGHSTHGPGATVEIDRLDVLVAEGDRVAFRSPGGVQREGRDGTFARLPRRGNAYSMPRKDTSNPGPRLLGEGLKRLQ